MNKYKIASLQGKERMRNAEIHLSALTALNPDLNLSYKLKLNFSIFKSNIKMSGES